MTVRARSATGRRTRNQQDLLGLITSVVYERHVRSGKTQARAARDFDNRLQGFRRFVSTTRGTYTLAHAQCHQRIVPRHGQRGRVDMRRKIELVVHGREKTAVWLEAEILRILRQGQ